MSVAVASPLKHHRLLRRRTWLSLGGGLLLAFALVSNVHAYWTTSGAGIGDGTAGTLAAPAVSGIAGPGIVSLSWTAVTPPGTGTVAYYVTRGGDAGGNCPTSAAPAPVLTCTDSGLSAGTYTYTVTAVWRSWTSGSSPAVPVLVASGAFTRFVLAAATTTPTAGQADNLTITAKDADGNTVASYTGSHNLTFAGAGTAGATNPTVSNAAGTQVNFGSNTAITFASGVATVSGSANGVMRLYKVETANITVAEGGSYTSGALAITVHAAAISKLSLAAATTTPTAGQADNLTITALDAYGNTATSYTGSHNLTFAGAGTAGATNPTVSNAAGTQVNFGSNTAITFASGVATVSGSANGVMRLYKVETANITVAEGGSYTSGALAITVHAAAISKLSLAAATTTPTAGQADNLTITALDAYGNTATSYTGSHNLTFAGAGTAGATNPTVSNAAGTQVNFGSNTAITFASGVATVSGSANGVMRLYKVETANITVAEGGSYTSGALAITVTGSYSLKVQYRNYDGATSDNQIKPGLQLLNTGSSSITLSRVTIRYWFTRDGGATSFSTWCDYAAISCANLTESVVAVSPSRPGADSYLQVGFTSGAASLAAGASAGDMQMRFNKTDWSNFNEANDYSYGTGTSYADSTKATVYVDGVLVWGTEP